MHDSTKETEKPPEAELSTWWYSACEHCTAKWFVPFQPVVCPRCGSPVLQPERKLPPWLDSAPARKLK